MPKIQKNPKYSNGKKSNIHEKEKKSKKIDKERTNKIQKIQKS